MTHHGDGIPCARRRRPACRRVTPVFRRHTDRSGNGLTISKLSNGATLAAAAPRMTYKPLSGSLCSQCVDDTGAAD
jgi:hypothetical protein